LLNHVVMDTTIRCTVIIVNVDNWLICVLYIYIYIYVLERSNTLLKFYKQNLFCLILSVFFERYYLSRQ
jgi:hypothetical protein